MGNAGLDPYTLTLHQIGAFRGAIQQEKRDGIKYSYLASRSAQISDKDFEDALRMIEGTPDPDTLDLSEMD